MRQLILFYYIQFEKIIAGQFLKDLDMVHDLAKEYKTQTPMSAQAAALFRILNSKGYDKLDGIAI